MRAGGGRRTQLEVNDLKMEEKACVLRNVSGQEKAKCGFFLRRPATGRSRH